MTTMTRATSQQESAVGRMVAAHRAWHAASYDWKGQSLVLTTANGTEATVTPEGKIIFNIILKP